MSWTNERVELLKKLWAEGYSASQVAKQMGGVTRNGVIGKVNRLGLPGRAKTSRSLPGPKQKPRVVSSTKPRSGKPKGRPRKDAEASRGTPSGVTAPSFQEAEAYATQLQTNNKGIPLLELETGQCRCPTGSGHKHRVTLYCGKPTLGSPHEDYCLTHYNLTRQKGTARKRGRPARTLTELAAD